MRKLYRLLKASDFKSVLDKRKCVVKNDCFSLYYAANNLTHARIGISASNKIGNAVIRVKVRRQVRAIIATISKKHDVYNLPVDVVIIIRTDFAKATYQDNYDKLNKAFSFLATMRK